MKMKTVKKAHIILASVLVLSMIAAADAVAAPAKGKVTLTFWNGFTSTDGDALKKLVNKFNSDNAGKIEIKMDIMQWDQLYLKLPPAIATGTAPSFVLMSPGNGLNYVKNKTLRDLGDFFSATGMDKSDFTDASLQFGQINGVQYLLPMNNYGICFYWNKDLFKEAGLDPESPPATLEQAAEYAVKLTDHSKKQYGWALPNKIGPAFYAILMRANGGRAVDMKAKKSVLNSPENLKTFNMIRDLTYAKRVSPQGATGPDLDTMMTSGKIGMFLNGPWLIPGLKQNKINFGIAAPPKGTAGQNTILDGTYFAIPTTTKDPEAIKAIYEFIKYWNSPEVSVEWSLAAGFPPYLKSVAKDSRILADTTLKAMVSMNDMMAPWNFGLNSAGTIDNDILWPMVESLQNGADTAQALAKASKDIDKALRKQDAK